jgi:hypothetical protein
VGVHLAGSVGTNILTRFTSRSQCGLSGFLSPPVCLANEKRQTGHGRACYQQRNKVGLLVFEDRYKKHRHRNYCGSRNQQHAHRDHPMYSAAAFHRPCGRPIGGALFTLPVGARPLPFDFPSPIGTSLVLLLFSWRPAPPAGGATCLPCPLLGEDGAALSGVGCANEADVANSKDANATNNRLMRPNGLTT